MAWLGWVSVLPDLSMSSDGDADDMTKRAKSRGRRWGFLDTLETNSPKHKKRNKRMTGVDEDFLRGAVKRVWW